MLERFEIASDFNRDFFYKKVSSRVTLILFYFNTDLFNSFGLIFHNDKMLFLYDMQTRAHRLRLNL